MAKKPAQNSAKQGPPVGRPFTPGMSGNPGGRPKGQMTLVKELLALGPEAIKGLAKAVKKEERWAIERVVEAFSVKELIIAAMMESGEEASEFDWAKVDKKDFATVISIARKAQAKTK